MSEPRCAGGVFLEPLCQLVIFVATLGAPLQARPYSRIIVLLRAVKVRFRGRKTASKALAVGPNMWTRSARRFNM